MTANTYNAEFLDTETDEMVDLFTFRAGTEREAMIAAQEEADYQGFHLGAVRMIEAAQ
jgi:hypothetical protein